MKLAPQDSEFERAVQDVHNASRTSAGSALVADDTGMSSLETEREEEARWPENPPVALVASAEKGTGPGHLAASPLRDRTNVRAAAAEASPSSDAVAESEEEDDSGPARSRRPARRTADATARSWSRC